MQSTYSTTPADEALATYNHCEDCSKDCFQGKIRTDDDKDAHQSS